jgi:hypothetical protein
MPVERGSLMLGFTALSEREILAAVRCLRMALAEVHGEGGDREHREERAIASSAPSGKGNSRTRRRRHFSRRASAVLPKLLTQNSSRKPRLTSRVDGSPFKTRAMELIVPTVPVLLMLDDGTAKLG